MTFKKITSLDRTERRTYTSPFVRNPASVPKRWRFEKRDRKMLVTIFNYEGMLTSCQLEALHFAPSELTDRPRSAKRSAETRLQYLYHQGYLDRLQVLSLGEGRSTIVNLLDQAGIDYVTATLGLNRTTVNWRPKIVKNKPTTLYHSLLVNDVRLVFERVAQLTELKLKHWIGERAMKSKRMRDEIPFLMSGARKSFKKAPDGAFALEYPATDYPDQKIQPVGFFLEVDRGTESHSVWMEKVMAYEQFRQSGLSEQYYGVKNFRVLVTATSTRRLNSLMETTQKTGGRSYYWFALQKNIDIFRPHQLLEDIWSVIGWQGRYSLKSLKINPK